MRKFIWFQLFLNLLILAFMTQDTVYFCEYSKCSWKECTFFSCWVEYSVNQTQFVNGIFGASLVTQTVNNLPAMQETWVRSLGQEDPLEKGMATRSSFLAWRIPWTEEPGWLQSMGSQRVRHNWVTQQQYLCRRALGTWDSYGCCNPGFPIPRPLDWYWFC